MNPRIALTLALAAVLAHLYAPAPPCRWYLTDNGNGTPVRLVLECL